MYNNAGFVTNQKKNIKMENEMIKIKKEIPKFVSIVLIVLGGVDLARGFIHTVLLEYAAINIAGLDLTNAANDQLRLLGTFGISNWITSAATDFFGEDVNMQGHTRSSSSARGKKDNNQYRNAV